MNNSIHLIILSVAVLVGGYYFYREINKMKDKFSNLERLHHNIKDDEKEKEKPLPNQTFYSNVETNNAILENEFANFTYDENENTDSENNHIEENMNEQLDEHINDTIEKTPSELESELQSTDKIDSPQEVSLVANIINENNNTHYQISEDESHFSNENVSKDSENIIENAQHLHDIHEPENEIFNNQVVNISQTENDNDNGNEKSITNTNIEPELIVNSETTLPDDSDENSSEEKMEIIESYLNNQSGNISLSNKEELLKHYNSFKLNDIKSEFVKLGLKVPKGKKKELIDELINNMNSSNSQ